MQTTNERLYKLRYATKENNARNIRRKERKSDHLSHGGSLVLVRVSWLVELVVGRAEVWSLVAQAVWVDGGIGWSGILIGVVLAVERIVRWQAGGEWWEVGIRRELWSRASGRSRVGWVVRSRVGWSGAVWSVGLEMRGSWGRSDRRWRRVCGRWVGSESGAVLRWVETSGAQAGSSEGWVAVNHRGSWDNLRDSWHDVGSWGAAVERWLHGVGSGGGNWGFLDSWLWSVALIGLLSVWRDGAGGGSALKILKSALQLLAVVALSDSVLDSSSLSEIRDLCPVLIWVC